MARRPTGAQSKTCSVRTCDLPARQNGVCDLHHRRLTKRESLARRDLKAAARVRGRMPSMSWYREAAAEQGWTPVSTLVSWFGTWNAVMDVAGLRARPYRRSDADVSAALRAAVRRSGGYPTEEWFRQRSAAEGWPSVQTVLRVHGTWNQALAAAGIDKPRRRLWTATDVRKALVDAHRVLGRDFDQTEYAAGAREHGWPSVPTVRAHYQTWQRALASARRARR